MGKWVAKILHRFPELISVRIFASDPSARYVQRTIRRLHRARTAYAKTFENFNSVSVQAQKSPQHQTQRDVLDATQNVYTPPKAPWYLNDWSTIEHLLLDIGKDAKLPIWTERHLRHFPALKSVRILNTRPDQLGADAIQRAINMIRVATNELAEKGGRIFVVQVTQTNSRGYE